jgi:hypothetical protein
MVAALEEALFADFVLVEETTHSEYEGPHWDKRRPLRAYLEELGFRTVDKRPGGSLWAIADENEFSDVKSYLRERGVEFGYAKNGGRASGYQPAHYTKYEK